MNAGGQEPELKDLSETDVGSYVAFGSYEQDNDAENGSEAIEWLVLAKEDNRLLLISKYALECKPYNENQTDVTWEKCTLRQWLNDEFMKEAFSSEELSLILKTKVSADKNPTYDTDAGNPTEDCLFLLSISEANKYFDSNTARQCEPTAYTIKQGGYKNNDGYCWWWLRSPGYASDDAAVVNYGGSVIYAGYDVDYDLYCVRPAMWINLES